MPRTSHELRFTNCETPKVELGQVLHCAVRGDVIVVGLSNGRIAWPLGRKPGNANRMLVVYRGLKRAVEREAAAAVCYHWGVTPQTVSKWRKAMGVGPNTVGNSALRRAHALRNWLRVKPKFHAKVRAPERAAKISAAKLGKKQPPHVLETLRQSHLGRTQSATTRARRSATLRAIGHRPKWLNMSWTEDEDVLLSQYSVAEVARLTGRTLSAVFNRRAKLKLTDGRNKSGRRWTEHRRAHLPSDS